MVVVSSFSSSTTFEGLADSSDVRVFELKSSMANMWAMRSLVDFKRLQRRANVVIGGVLRQCDGSDDVVGVFVWLAAVTRLGWVHLGPWDLGADSPAAPCCHSDASCPIWCLMTHVTVQSFEENKSFRYRSGRNHH